MSAKYSSFIESNLDHPELHIIAHGKAVIYTHCAPYKETENQDSVCVMERSNGDGILAVADGVGGERAGSMASRTMIESLLDNFSTNTVQELQSVLLSSVDQANHAILGQGVGAATTLAAVEINNEQIRPYHIGDSDILLVGQRGKIKFQTIAHSPVGYAVESGLLDQDEAVGHEERHYVSNVVGSNEMRIDIGPILTMSKRDRLLIASDGVSDNLLIQDIIELIRSGPIEKAAKRLLQACQQRMQEENSDPPGKPDDLSFILYQRA